MADKTIYEAIVDKCTFLYDNEPLSQETIIKQYLSFFADQFNPEERSVSFAFHTGSICFNAVSVAALMIGCLAYEFSSNDDIIAGLSVGDIVLYNGKRYRWGGIEKGVSYSGITKENTDWIVLIQDAVGKDGKTIIKIPYEAKKHLIRPYFGNSSETNGLGIRKENSNRTEFIAYVLGIPEKEVPSAIDLSVVVVGDKSEIIEICKRLTITYENKKKINLTDVVPIAYYAGSGEQSQIGQNVSKLEPVIKITSKISMARELVLDKQGNRVIGILVTNVDSLVDNSSELNDLLRRKSLKFSYVLAPFDYVSCRLVMEQEQFEAAKLFVCTKEFLEKADHEIKSPNKLTNQLNKQISNIIHGEKTVIKVDSPLEWERFRKLKESLYNIKQSNWTGEKKDTFIISALALLNLFSTSFFSMKKMISAVLVGKISRFLMSPEDRLVELRSIAEESFPMKEQCMDLVNELYVLYSKLYDINPKEDALVSCLKMNYRKKIVLVVPKAYYCDLFANYYQYQFPNVSCVTVNKFSIQDQYDMVLLTGDIVGKKFDANKCFVAEKMVLLLYEHEEKGYLYRKGKAEKINRKVNARILGTKADERSRVIESAEDSLVDNAMQEFSELDDYVNSLSQFDLNRYVMKGENNSDHCNLTEVKYLGVFTTGEHILFSKYYEAVVFDQKTRTIKEMKPENLSAGDLLVFTKKSDYTRNIVDQIFDQLLQAGKLSQEVSKASRNALYWKEALRKYKNDKRLTYSALSKQMRTMGCSIQEVSIRQWLIEESHIVGPRDEKTMRVIAELTQDEYLLHNLSECFDACKIVRHHRRAILKLIAEAIIDKLSKKQPKQGSVFEVVFENVDQLSETLELEAVNELDNAITVNSGMINRPISELEVSM